MVGAHMETVRQTRGGWQIGGCRASAKSIWYEDRLYGHDLCSPSPRPVGHINSSKRDSDKSQYRVLLNVKCITIQPPLSRTTR